MRWWEENRCFKCKHWGGDRAEVLARIGRWTREGYDLDKLEGFEDGECSLGPGGVNVEIHGDATAEVTVDAEFGCPGFRGMVDGG